MFYYVTYIKYRGKSSTFTKN